MRKITIILLAIMMINLLCGCGDKTEYPKAIDVDSVEDFFDVETRYLPDEENVLTVSEETEGGFLVKEKRFTYEYKDYILFDVTNETDKNYNLTVHAKYFDASGKRLDETWEVYSDFAAGHQQYILLDPDIKFAECECDFQVKETESDCWRSKVKIRPDEMFVHNNKPSVLWLNFEIINDTNKTINTSFKGILLFDQHGDIYNIYNTGVKNIDEGAKSSSFSLSVSDTKSEERVSVPEELKDGYIAIVVIDSIF